MKSSSAKRTAALVRNRRAAGRARIETFSGAPACAEG
jgi:hypothetical protein